MKSNTRALPALASALGLLGALLTAPAALAASDAEAATHGDKAATPQVAFEEAHGDFLMRQYELGCLSQLSYLIASGGEAAVVDPQRDVDHYIRDAEAHGVRITAVILTHTNADFVAGHTELAKRLGAKVYISAKSDSAFPYVALRDGDGLAIGDAQLTFWDTPGHTLDSMTVLVSAPGATPSPAYALTGDTLFIGGIGRPDLVGGEITPSVLASMAFDSIQRLKTLPDATKVLPGHGAGSLCGAHLSDDTSSTIGAEKKTNPYLLLTARAPFVAKVVSGLPVAPQYFKYNVAMNREGPPVVDWDQQTPPARTPARVAAALKQGAWLLDLRDQASYAAGHVKGSINVAVRGRLDTWTGIVVPFDEDLYLLGTLDEVKEATFRLRRVGYDRITGFVEGGIDAWRAAGQEVRTSKLVDGADLAQAMARGAEPMIVDVRTAGEFAEQRVGNYANIPVDQYHRLGKTLDKSKPVVLMCNSAYRSSMAVGLAEREGFTDIGSLEGGLHAWVDAGRPVISGEGTVAAPAQAASGSAAPLLLLPEVIDAHALATALMDAPRLYAVIDVRAPWQFAEYHVPGAVNLEPGAVAGHLATLPAGSRIVIVDRDGSVAFSVAGAVLNQLGAAAPSLRVLSGGTAAYYHQVELGDGAAPAGITATPATYAPPTTAPRAAPAAPAPKPATKKRNAGC
ncbi:MAG: rhodanese-like domain-containing protein [Myxococcota bacterium]